MSYLKISIGIFLALAASRFVPHPPNFTSLLALSFYIPAIIGIRYLPALIVSFIITDAIIGFHSTIFFTWTSVLIIGLISKYFLSTMINRLIGVIFGVCIFYILTNFGVWTKGFYGYSLEGLLTCYILALPFFGYSLVSTIIFSAVIETINKFYVIKLKKFFK